MTTETDPKHVYDIIRLRKTADALREVGKYDDALSATLAADLLEIHDATGISLDNWASARLFVEQRLGRQITENGV